MSGLTHRVRWGDFIFQLCLSLAAVLGLGIAAVSPVLADDGLGSLIHAYSLLPGLQARVLTDGSLVIASDQAPAGQYLLRAAFAPRTDRTPGVQDTIFAALFTEGDPGGHRGLARDADDDGDGLIDEERANGRDDDGDGQIDEDFAAISDAMVVLDRTEGEHVLHLQTYHWSYCHLQPTVMWDGFQEGPDAEGSPSDLVLRLNSGRWYQADFAWRLFGAAGVSPARPACLFVAAAVDSARPGNSIWLGVTLLSTTGDREAPGQRVLLNEEAPLLEIPPVDGCVRVAISVAPTLLQLRYNLMAAHGVYRGILDKDSGRQVAWIVPPLCPVGLKGQVPPARWGATTQAGWELVFSVQPGQFALLDPDRFRINGSPLGSPVKISWLGQAGPEDEPVASSQNDLSQQDKSIPEDAVHGASGPASESGSELRDDAAREGWSLDWAPVQPEAVGQMTVAQLDPYNDCLELLRHAGRGELIFEFASRKPEADPEGRFSLSGWCLTGRPFRIDLEPEQPNGGEASSIDTVSLRPEEGSQLRSGSQGPSLAPALLDNFPNPFRMQTNIRYRIPATVAEGFVWEKGQDPGLSPDAPIPYKSSQPMVTLKIYNIGGQEIAALFAGPLGLGDYEVLWDGTDTSGRQVASGTYFCKLQIENWSVTKRLVFIR